MLQVYTISFSFQSSTPFKIPMAIVFQSKVDSFLPKKLKESPKESIFYQTFQCHHLPMRIFFFFFLNLDNVINKSPFLNVKFNVLIILGESFPSQTQSKISMS